MKGLLFPVLGAFGVELPKQNRGFGKVPGLLFSDALMILGVGLALLLFLAGGIYLWMKLRRRRRRHISGGQKVYRGSHDHDGADEPEDGFHDAEGEPDEDDDDVNDNTEDEEEHHHHHHHHGRRRYKYRVRRRGHRTRNPTLAETGGLPPVKTQEPGKPC